MTGVIWVTNNLNQLWFLPIAKDRSTLRLFNEIYFAGLYFMVGNVNGIHNCMLLENLASWNKTIRQKTNHLLKTLKFR